MDATALTSYAADLLGEPLALVIALNPTERRTNVLRCRTPDRTVIVKQANDPREHDALMQLAGTGIAPGLLAADAAHHVVVMEDLPGVTLHDVLQGADAAAAEAAVLEFASVFAALHRRTSRAGMAQHVDASRIGRLWGMEATGGVEIAVNALTQMDVGPDGCMIFENGARLFDFELAEDGASLTDIVMWRMGFPNCGVAAGVFPDALLRRMENAYGAIDADEYGRAYSFRLLQRLERYDEWKVQEEDWMWGPASGRQRLLWMLRQCPEAAPFAREFRELHERLRATWPATPDTMPLFPAFTSDA